MKTVIDQPFGYEFFTIESAEIRHWLNTVGTAMHFSKNINILQAATELTREDMAFAHYDRDYDGLLTDEEAFSSLQACGALITREEFDTVILRDARLAHDSKATTNNVSTP